MRSHHGNKKMYTMNIAMLLAVLLSATLVANGRTDDASQNQLANKIITGQDAERVKVIAATADCSTITQHNHISRSENNLEKDFKNKLVFRTTNGFKLFHKTTDDGPLKAVVSGFNSSYGFQVESRDGKSYLLEVFDTPTEEPKFATHLKPTEVSVKRLLLGHYNVGDWTLDDLLKRPDLRVNITTGDSNYTCDVTQPSPQLIPKGLSLPVVSGQIVINKKNYSVETVDVNRLEGATLTRLRKESSVEEQRGASLLKQSKTYLYSSIKQSTVPHTSSLSEFEYDWNSMSTDRFYLTYYGLPEPEGVARDKPTPIWVWMVVAASGLAILTLGIRFLQNRAARKVAAA